MKFGKQDLIDGAGGEHTPGPTVLHEITGSSRWSLSYRRVFEFEGRFYLTTYSVRATEMQCGEPYEYAPDEIECTEVFPTTRIDYQPRPSEDGQP